MDEQSSKSYDQNKMNSEIHIYDRLNTIMKKEGKKKKKKKKKDLLAPCINIVFLSYRNAMCFVKEC